MLKSGQRALKDHIVWHKEKIYKHLVLMISHIKLEQIKSAMALPSNGVRISISAYSKNTIVQPHIYRICHTLNSSFIDLHNFVTRAKTCLMICKFLPITVTQRKFCQECIISLPNLQNVALHIFTMQNKSSIEEICNHKLCNIDSHKLILARKLTHRKFAYKRTIHTPHCR